MSPEFPNYKRGSDVDVLAYSAPNIIDELKHMFPLKETPMESGHTHLDYMIDGKIDIRFDIWESVISEKFTVDLIGSSRVIVRDGVAYIVPSEEFDGMSKYSEYLIYPKRKTRYAEFKKYKPLLDAYTH